MAPKQPTAEAIPSRKEERERWAVDGEIATEPRFMTGRIGGIGVFRSDFGVKLPANQQRFLFCIYAQKFCNFSSAKTCVML